jgi:CMP-N,N'-diacetyllegionaminic acid synthase
MARILGLITARAGSQRVNRKNMRLLAGRPLISYTIDAATQSSLLDRVVLSTDCPMIANLARQNGVEVPFMRPPELAKPTSRVIDAALHALNALDAHDAYRPDAVMLLQPTSPFRTSGDIDETIDMLTQSPASEAVVSVTADPHHPFLSRGIDDSGALTSLAGFSPWHQDLPPTFRINGAVYLVRTKTLRQTRNWSPRRPLAHLMPAERALDIDTEWDFMLAQYAMAHRLRGDQPPEEWLAQPQQAA